ncbi:MAG: hypothetical protein NT126_01435 [Bacteroidetes bacterium]|nr:hypothetical protein [Bacteroidota bacterium]
MMVFVCSCISCSEKKNSSLVDHSSGFTLPGILEYDHSMKDSFSLFNAENIVDASTFFIGKYAFDDTIRIDNSGVQSNSYGDDYITGDSTSLRQLRDSLSSDGLQIIPDYKRSIPINWLSLSKVGIYFPIYVVNETSSDKLFTARDKYVSAIQEAKDKEEKWRPIESKKFDFIGNGRWALILHPHEFALFIVAKYEGDFQTHLRIRMKVGDVVYLSKAFEGSINEKQFYLKPGSYQYEEFKKNNPISITRRFLGSIPLEPKN